MKQAMEGAAASLQFEKAGKIKERIVFIQRYCKRQRFVRRFMSETLILHEVGAVSLTHVFIKGDHSTRKGLLSKKQVNKLLNKCLNSIQTSIENDRCLLDRANVVYNWMMKKEG